MEAEKAEKIVFALEKDPEYIRMVEKFNRDMVEGKLGLDFTCDLSIEEVARIITKALQKEVCGECV